MMICHGHFNKLSKNYKNHKMKNKQTVCGIVGDVVNLTAPTDCEGGEQGAPMLLFGGVTRHGELRKG